MTLNTSYTNGPHAWTAGCHGTSYFYRALMRLANIPVHYYYLEPCGYGVPVFSTISRTLSHGDDVISAASHAGGTVYEWFSPWYAVQYLESANLWKRLAERAADPGFCDA